MACRGCHSRLELAVGTSGYCYLAGKVAKVVNHRYPTAKARELTHLLAKVLATLESDCELFEADRASGLVDAQGYLVEQKKAVKEDVEKKATKSPTKGEAVAGEHPGKEHPSAGPSTAVKEEIEGTKKSKSSRARSRSRHRRRQRSRSRRRESKKSRGTPSPVVVEEQAEVVGTEPEGNDEVEEPEGEEEEAPEDGSQDEEVEQNPKKFELRQTAKPSSRKPLPRRPRTPSVSPPGYHSRDPAPLKRWKGWQHVYRGQQSKGKQRVKGRAEKAAPPKVSHGTEGDETACTGPSTPSSTTSTRSAFGRRGRSGQHTTAIPVSSAARSSKSTGTHRGCTSFSSSSARI